MAKKDEFKTGRSKITVMMFQLEGTDETLREGIRTIGQALGTVLKPLQVIPAKLNNVGEGDAAIAPETPDLFESEENPPDNGVEQRDTRTAKPRSPTILDLDIKSAKTPLKDFCEGKKVGDSDSDRYLAIAFWLKENLSIAEVTMDHIHTCYRFLNWQTPTDASSPLRNGKQQGWFTKGKAKGAYILNHVGDNKVMGMGNGK